MSEGKSAVVTLSPEARRRMAIERERRALRQIKMRLDALHDEAGQIHSDYGVDVKVDRKVPPHRNDPEAIREVVLELQSRATRARSELDRAVAGAVDQRETSHDVSLEGASVSSSEVMEDRKRADSEDEPSISDQRIATAFQNAHQALDRLHTAAPSELRDHLEGRVMNIADMRVPSDAESLATEVMTTVHETNAEMKSTLERLDELMAGLLASSAAEVAVLHSWLERVRAGKAPIDLQELERVEELIHDEEQRAEDQFVTSATAEVFRSLGYEIETGFSSLLEAQGVSAVRRPEWGSHVVVVRREDGDLTMKLERTVDSSAGVEFDVAAQTQFCSDYDRLEAAMESRGVEFDTKKIPPGVIASEKTARIPTGFTTRREERELRQREIGG